MATKKKMLQAAAGVGGAGLDIPDVFSTYLYKANSTARSITNGIDLAGEGGLVWLKSRSSTREHALYDTERGAEKLIKSNSTGAQQTTSGGLTAFNSDGFSLGTYGDVNGTSYGDFASWSFRKAPKFFDCVTYTGDGTSNRQIAHNLGSTPGMVIVKNTQRTSNWAVLHKDAGLMFLNDTGAAYSDADTGTQFGDGTNRVDPTSTNFTVASSSATNQNGEVHVAYLFAHNDGDGEFGPDNDQDIIKCGSYTGNGSTSNGPHIDLGFEPQWILIRRATGSGAVNWSISDNMRGFHHGYQINLLYPNSSATEAVIGTTPSQAVPTPTGFQIQSTGTNMGTNGETFIYMAIRRGPLAPPEAATEVFAMANLDGTPPTFASSMDVVDMAFHRSKTATSQNFEVHDRLRQGSHTKGHLALNTTEAEATSGNILSVSMDYMYGYANEGNSNDWQSWMWKRAPSFFDAVAYTGSGVAGRTVSHNLGVAPEMIWVKQRNGGDWGVYHKDIGNDKVLLLNDDGVEVSLSTAWNNTTPTYASFTVGTWVRSNGNGSNIIAYLFASLDGVSKVGSYTGTGSQRVINCGFSSGARFVLIKRTDVANYHWYLWDSMRGIVAGADPFLMLNRTNAQIGTDDLLDPDSSGFSLATGSAKINASGGNYIFYAIA